MKQRLAKRVGHSFTTAAQHWIGDDASTLSAALAFYCAFSLAPLLVIILKVTSWFIGSELAYGQLDTQLTSLFGQATASVLLAAMKGSQNTDGTIATIVSVGTLLIGATTVFSALESALEKIWRSQSSIGSALKGWLRTRLLSFGLILALAFLLLVSLTLSTAMSAFKALVLRRHTELQVLINALDLATGIALSTFIIALIYRYMPAKRLAWFAVIRGAFITALLFQLGRWLIGLYLARSTQASAFGAAASFVALLLWLYYSAMIFLFGAEITVSLGDPEATQQKHDERQVN